MIEAKADSLCAIGKDLVQLDLVMEIDVAREVTITHNDEIDEVAFRFEKRQGATFADSHRRRRDLPLLTQAL